MKYNQEESLEKHLGKLIEETLGRKFWNNNLMKLRSSKKKIGRKILEKLLEELIGGKNLK